MLVVAITIALGLGIFGSSKVDAHDSSKVEINTEYKRYKSVMLQEGDTLWGIAEEYMDESYSSIEEYIIELKKINNLDSDEIHEGSYLMIAYNNQ
jgi:LysM repeat protein